MKPAAKVERQETQLVIDDNGMSIGESSVGLPIVRTTEIVLSKYLELIRLVSPVRRSGIINVRAGDIELLAATIGVEPDTIGERITNLQL